MKKVGYNFFFKFKVMSIVNEIIYFLLYFNGVIQSLGHLGQGDICLRRE